jgi:phosphinothricin acetyltransferase
MILDRLAADARGMGIETILASVSSANEGSIDFHRKYGFAECGCFRSVGKKSGKDFDEVWLQLFL